MFIFSLRVHPLSQTSVPKGVACRKSNVRVCGESVNAFMQKKIKKGGFTNSVDLDETPQNTASQQGMRYLQCKHILLFIFVNGC